MAYKEFRINIIGPVTVYKRRGTRNMRLSISHDGKVRVSIPTWVPYASGLAYAKTKQLWILEHTRNSTTDNFYDGQPIGKHHILRLKKSQTETIRTRILRNREILVRYPLLFNSDDENVQLAVQTACIRALRKEAEDILPTRIRQLSEQHNLPFKSFSVRQLKGRWGSCDQNRHITMNLFTMQLPWELLDYVILHELAHTKHLNHSTEFWKTLNQLDPSSKQHRKELKAFKPVVGHGAN